MDEKMFKEMKNCWNGWMYPLYPWIRIIWCHPRCTVLYIIHCPFAFSSHQLGKEINFGVKCVDAWKDSAQIDHRCYQAIGPLSIASSVPFASPCASYGSHAFPFFVWISSTLTTCQPLHQYVTTLNRIFFSTGRNRNEVHDRAVGLNFSQSILHFPKYPRHRAGSWG